MSTTPEYCVTHVPGGFVKLYRLERRKTPPAPSKKEEGQPHNVPKERASKETERMLRKYADRQRNLLYLVKSLSRGGIFATLTYDVSTAKKRKRILLGWKGDLDRFVKRFRRAFPRGGLIWTVELNPDNEAVHFHLIVKPGCPMSPPRFQSWARAKWARVSKNTAPDAVKASYLNRKRRNYVTKRKKKPRALALIAHLGTRYNFGVIAKENLRLVSPVRRILPASAVEEIRKLLAQATEAQALFKNGEIDIQHLNQVTRADFISHVYDDPGLGQKLESIMKEAE